MVCRGLPTSLEVGPSRAAHKAELRSARGAIAVLDLGAVIHMTSNVSHTSMLPPLFKTGHPLESLAAASRSFALMIV